MGVGQNQLAKVSVAIANGASLSAAVDLRGGRLVGIQMPATWTSAGITFQASADGTAFQDVYDKGGTEVAITVVQAHFVALDPATLQGMDRIKVRSGTGGSPVAQGADRALVLLVAL